MGSDGIRDCSAIVGGYRYSEQEKKEVSGQLCRQSTIQVGAEIDDRQAETKADQTQGKMESQRLYGRDRNMPMLTRRRHTLVEESTVTETYPGSSRAIDETAV